MPGIDGVNEFTAAELEELFSDEFQSDTPPTEQETEPQKATDTEIEEKSVPALNAFVKN